MAPLDEYRGKRRFEKTPEPSGRKREKGPARKAAAPGDAEAALGGGLFVVHKHAARQLHYDFRLELGGVLKSWAVPKGPSLDPARKRLAVHVEDHPIEYGDFEGVIPEGEYGAGTVQLWDRGRWTPLEDPSAALAKGSLKFTLDGEKLSGRWALVRLKPKGGEPADKNWLLIKDSDESARRGAEADVSTARPKSVASGRTIEEIARGAAGAAPRVDVARLAGARESETPEWVDPELATLVEDVPDGEGWLHEIKLDGYRMLSFVDGGRARLFTRNRVEWTERLQALAAAASDLPAKRAILDGELVVLAPDGSSSFAGLKEALSAGAQDRLTYFVFDLLHLDGYDLREVALSERKRALADLLGAEAGARAGAEAGARAGVEAGARAGVAAPIRYVDHIGGAGKEFFRQACGFALEGVVSKRADSRYRSGRGRDWLKSRCLRRQEFVIGGYTEPGGSRAGFGALLLGVRDEADATRPPDYAGRVGTGFTEALLATLGERLRGLERSELPFVGAPTGAGARGVHWVEPRLVCEVSFTEWTREGRLRHPSFVGLREDKPPDEVVREDPAALVAKITLTHPDRVFYEEAGITKRELALYYERVAPWMLPHVAGRPLSLVRCPEGRSKECFFQKHIEEAFPEAVHRVELAERKGRRDVYPMVDSVDGLVGLVQMGTLELHPWGARVDDVERPDRLVFDLDPDEGLPFGRVVDATRLLHARLVEIGLASFVKTTGGKGLHVVVPVIGRHGWEEARAFSKAVAQDLARRAPADITASMSKSRRAGKVFVDWVRNTRGSTSVAPYSTRARHGAPVSVPLRWAELGASTRPDRYTVANLPRRLAALDEDPWLGFGDVRQSLTKEARAGVGMDDDD